VDAVNDSDLTDEEYISMLKEEWLTCDGIRPDQAKAMWKTRNLSCPIFETAYGRRRFREKSKEGMLDVYRGQIEGCLNFSWTLNLNKGAWFAFRYPYSPMAETIRKRDGLKPRNTELLMAKVAPDKVLGFFTSRRESEIVVDFEDVDDIRVHPSTPYFRPMDRL